MSVEPTPPLVPRIAGHETRLLDAGDGALVQQLFERCNDFFDLINGRPVLPEEAADFFGRELPYERTIFGVTRPGEERLIALVELVRGAPTPDDVCIGLLVIDPSGRGAGLGTLLVGAIAACATTRQARRLTIVVQHANTKARDFWLRFGFVPYAEEVGATKYAAEIARAAALASAI
jgi:GNAT superfamily N-acetyltransferase